MENVRKEVYFSLWLDQAGDLIARLELDDPSAVRKAVPYEDGFPPLGPPTPMAGKVHQRCAASIHAAENILAGYEHDIEDVRKTYILFQNQLIKP